MVGLLEPICLPEAGLAGIQEDVLLPTGPEGVELVGSTTSSGQYHILLNPCQPSLWQTNGLQQAYHLCFGGSFLFH